MGKVRLAARVPDDQYHGLMSMSQRLLDRPHEVVLAVVKLDVGEIRTLIHDEGDEKHEGDEYIPVVKLLAIEPILHQPERARLAEIYVNAYRARTGDGQTLDEAGGVLEFTRSRDAQETGESGWPSPCAPSCGLDRDHPGGCEASSDEGQKEEPGDETAGQDGEEHDGGASSSDSTDEVTGDGTGQALPPVPDAAYAEDAVPLPAAIEPLPEFEGRALRSVPLPSFAGPAAAGDADNG